MAHVVIPVGGAAYAFARRISRQALFRHWDSLQNGAYDIGTYLVPDKPILLGQQIKGTEIGLEYRLKLPQNWWQKRETSFSAMNEIRTVVGHIKVGLSKYPDRENDLAVVKWRVEHGKNLSANSYPVIFKADVFLYQHPIGLYSPTAEALQAANR